MKNLLIILLISTLIFTACKSEDNQSDENPTPAVPISDPTSDAEPPVVDPTPDVTPPVLPPQADPDPPFTPPPFVPNPEPEPTPDPTPDVEETIIMLALLTDATTDKLYFYDGTNFIDQSSDNPKYCGYRCFTDGTILNYYNTTGDVSSSHNLIVAPDFIYRSDKTYIIENIDPATAYSLGAQYKNYSKYWFDGIEQQWWFFNQYQVVDIFKIGTDVFTTDSGKIVRDINENLIDINATDGLIIHDFDYLSRTATIRTPDSQDHSVSWGLNNFNNAEYWQFSDDVWYSNNGYEFDGFSLAENANPLWDWNAKIIIGAGTRVENSETVLYWIDASSGWLWRYIVSIDNLAQVWRLYSGDGERSTGQAKIDILKPVLIGAELFYSEGGAIWKIDIDSGLGGVFYGGNGLIKEF